MSHARGFTLLELLVATGMMAMLALSLYLSLGIAFRARETARAQTLEPRLATSALDVLERDFQSLPPPTGILAGPFIGYGVGIPGQESDALVFHALSGPDANDSTPLAEGIRRIELRVRTDQSPPALVRLEQRNLLATAPPPPTAEVLIRGMKAFSLRYFDGTGWRDEWDSTLLGNMLPLAIEISIELPAKENATRGYRVSRIVPVPTGRAVAAESEI